MVCNQAALLLVLLLLRYVVRTLLAAPSQAQQCSMFTLRNSFAAELSSWTYRLTLTNTVDIVLTAPLSLCLHARSRRLAASFLLDRTHTRSYQSSQCSTENVVDIFLAVEAVAPEAIVPLLMIRCPEREALPHSLRPTTSLNLTLKHRQEFVDFTGGLELAGSGLTVTFVMCAPKVQTASLRGLCRDRGRQIYFPLQLAMSHDPTLKHHQAYVDFTGELEAVALNSIVATVI